MSHNPTRFSVTSDSYVRASREDDITHLARNMREADRAEIMAAGHYEPWEALTDGYRHSDQPWTYVVRGKPAAMFGVCRFDQGYPRHGIIWLLGTSEATRYPLAFMRHAKDWLKRVACGYEAVGNYVDERNQTHVRFLRALGFQFGPPEPYGADKLPFIPFSKILNTCATPSQRSRPSPPE